MKEDTLKTTVVLMQEEPDFDLHRNAAMAALLLNGAFIVARFARGSWVGAVSCSAGYLGRVSYEGQS